MADPQYFRVIAYINNEPGKRRHSVRVGSATRLPDGGYEVKLDTLPIGQWDQKLRLYPSTQQDEERQNNG